MKVRRAAGLLAALLWLCVLALVLGPACFDGRAAAQPVAPRLHGVVVTSEEGPALDEALLAALRELFTRVGLVLVETDEGKDEGLLARVRIQRDSDAATVRVFSVTAKKLASTHRVPRAETDALFRETVAHVVLNAVEPLVVERVELEATMVGVAEPAPDVAPTAEEGPRRERPAAHYGLGLGGAALVIGELWGARLSGRADVYVATRLPSVFGLTLGGVLPRTRERGNVHSRFGILFARVSAGVEPWASRFARLGILLSAGVDLLRAEAEPKARHMADQVLPRQRVPDFMLGALVQMRFLLGGGFELQALVGCDLDLNPHEFAVKDGANRTKLFSPYRARPYAGLNVAWSSL